MERSKGGKNHKAFAGVYKGLSLLGVLFFLLAMAPAAEEQLFQLTRDFLKGFFGKRTFQIEGFRSTFDEETGFYIVAFMLKEGKRRPRPVLLYISKDKRFVFLGKVFEAKGARELSRGHFERLIPPSSRKPKEVDMDKVTFREPALGKGEKVLIISNPACPHCRRLLPSLIDHFRGEASTYALSTYALYYMGIPFGKKLSRLEELIECVRQKRPDLFWEFLRVCYTSSEAEATNWLKQRLGEGFSGGCSGDDLRQRIEADGRKADEIGVEGIPAAVIEGRLYEGTRSIEEKLIGD